MIRKEQKAAVSEPFKAHVTDTGSTSVQVAVLTARINDLSSHLNQNKKDYSSRVGLLKMVGQRRRLLDYLSKSEPAQYTKILSELKLRK